MGKPELCDSLTTFVDCESNLKTSLMESSQAKHGLVGSDDAIQRTQYPYVTGTSIAAMKYKDGILMAADMGG